MTENKSTTGRKLARHVIPFAPLALALSMSMSSPSQTTSDMVSQNAVTEFPQSCLDPHFPSAIATAIDQSNCGPDGSGRAETLQNEAKNNFCALDPAKAITIPEIISLQEKVQQDPSIPFGNTRNHPLSSASGPATDRGPLVKMGEGDQVALEGYVLIARQEGAESVNCGKSVPNKAEYHDFHISIGQNADAAECSGVVVEMIPHHRPALWTRARVQAVANAHLMVRVTGQLMFDSSHSPCVNGTNLSGDPARASLWEIHPIYTFEVCPHGACDANGGWVLLEDWNTD